MTAHEKDVDKFRTLLKKASGEVADEYFRLPVAGSPDPIYRERVYCYELYHQLRSIWPDDFRYTLGGEVDKKSHPLFWNTELKDLKPDFLVHVPKCMQYNLVVMEVKRNDADKDDIRKDLKNLIKFVRTGQYKLAILLVFGDKKQAVTRARRCASEGEIDLDKIELWWHSKPGKEAKHIPW